MKTEKFIVHNLEDDEIEVHLRTKYTIDEMFLIDIEALQTAPFNKRMKILVDMLNLLIVEPKGFTFNKIDAADVINIINSDFIVNILNKFQPGYKPGEENKHTTN